jgi:hypothetical protein
LRSIAFHVARPALARHDDALRRHDTLREVRFDDAFLWRIASAVTE